jgi:hypothetical protein
MQSPLTGGGIVAKLAINGGPKVIDRQIGKDWPIFGDTERENLLEVLESGRWWRGGEAEDSMVARFEQAFARLSGREARGGDHQRHAGDRVRAEGRSAYVPATR